MAYKKDRYYCPKCNHKTLVQDYEWCVSSQSWHRTWKCLFNKPTRRRSYGQPPKKEKGPPCGCHIQTPGRDAEITDFTNPVDRLAQEMDNEPIINYLLRENHNIRRKGLEVIYAGKLAWAVRKTGSHGPEVTLYWRARTTDKDCGLLDPTNDGHRTRALFHNAAKGLSYRGEFLVTILNHQNCRLWIKNDEYEGVFEGNLTKKLKAEIAEWVRSFEELVEPLLNRAMELKTRWEAMEAKLDEDLKDTGVKFHNYNVFKNEVHINIRHVTPAEASALQAVWPVKITTGLINCYFKRPNRDYTSSCFHTTPEQAAAVAELLGIPNMELSLSGITTTPDVARKVAAILTKSEVRV